jgi:ABC-type transport system involved in multi-copper enzyme maturation permease subunit
MPTLVAGTLARPAPAHRTRRRRLSEFSQWAVIAKAQFRDYLRTHRFVGLVAFVALVSGVWLFFLVQAGTGLVRLSFLNSVSEFLTDYMASMPLWIILAAAFFGGDALSVDYNTGAGYYTLVLPVKRRTLLAGRYASASAVTLVVVLEYTAFGLLGAAYAFGRDAIPWTSLGTSLGLAVLFTFAVVSVAFFFSSFFESPATGVLVTILALAVGLTALQGVVQIAGYEPWWSLTYAGGAISSALDWDFTPKQTIPVGGGHYLTSWAATTSEGASIMLAYLVVFFVVTAVLYHRKEAQG